MTAKIWRILETPQDEIDNLYKTTGFPPILLKILHNRGLKDKIDIERFFDPRSRYLTTPFLLDGICEAVNRIYQAIDNDESIRIYGDRDVDGITSTVLLYEAIKEIWTKVDYTVPVIEDGYGLNPDYIDSAKRDGVTLIITVDCGISNVNEVEYAKSLGIDVIVTDHHEPPQSLPEAVAIVDPKITGSMYHQKNIAGVGVSFKLALAVEIARSPLLKHTIVAFDNEGTDIEAITFSPRNGFSKVKNLTPQSLTGNVLLFFNREEREEISLMIPEVKQSTGEKSEFQPIYLAPLISEHMQIANPTKESISLEMNFPPGWKGARRLIAAYLKLLEAIERSVKALWQQCLDILAIGTIADMVPMRGENRTFAQIGLKFAANTRRIGLLHLYSLLGWSKRILTERDVSYSIAPILNASGRLSSAELAIELLATDSPIKAQNLAKQLLDLNLERKKLGEECYKQVKEHLTTQNDLQTAKILLVSAPIPNQGVTGIVATRLMLDYCRPVIVLLEDRGKLLGSARSFNDINIIKALNACSQYLEKYGGHFGAAGLTVLPDNIDGFRNCLNEYAMTNITDDDLTAEWKIDARIDLEQIDKTFMNDLLQFSPYGIDNPAPLFLINNLPFQEIKKVGENKNHLRIKFRKHSGEMLYGIGFNLGALFPHNISINGICDLVFTIEPNDYNGVRSPQLVICDIAFTNCGTCTELNHAAN